MPPRRALQIATPGAIVRSGPIGTANGRYANLVRVYHHLVVCGPAKYGTMLRRSSSLSDVQESDF